MAHAVEQRGDIIANCVLNIAALDLLKSLPDESVGAIVADPPFFISTERRGGGVGDDPWVPGIATIDAMIDWSTPIAKEVKRVLRKGGASIVMGGSQSISAWEVAADRSGLKWMAELTVLWNTGKPRSRNFGSLATTIRWHIKPGAKHTFGPARAVYSNILVCHKVPLQERLHPAQKPVELTNFLISLLTQMDDLIVDPFCGAGSTLVSAKLCGRSWLGGDLDEEYCRIAEGRVLNADTEELRPIHLWVNNKLTSIEG